MIGSVTSVVRALRATPIAMLRLRFASSMSFQLRAVASRSVSDSDIIEFCQSGVSGTLKPENLPELLEYVVNSRRELAADLLLSLEDSKILDEDSLRKLTLCVCDEIGSVDSGKLLLQLCEFSTTRVSPSDFALLASAIGRAVDVLPSFSASEFTGLLAVCARSDFVDSDFNEAVQGYLPSVLSSFSDNQFPVLFASILRLGIDQPLDRVPIPQTEEKQQPAQSSPLMVALIAEIVRRVPGIAEAGCLAMLHAIVRRPKTKITPEMETLVHEISESSRIDEWGPALRIQAIHALSRLGIHNDRAIASLLQSISYETVSRVPSANLQHLLSIIHNHADRQDPVIWRPVLDVCVERIGQPLIARSMQMATIAVTIGYLGRLKVRNEFVVNTLLNVFCGRNVANRKALFTSKPVQERINRKMIERILTDSQVDIAHLTSICEALDRLNLWDLPLAAPLAMVTRRIIFRDGLHNVKAAPLSLSTACFLRNSFGLTDDAVRSLDEHIDAQIDSVASEGRVSTNWCLQSTGEFDYTDWRLRTVAALLEGLLKHEQYIRSTESAVRRCFELKELIASESWIHWSDVPENVRGFIDSLVLPEHTTDTA